MSFKLIAPLAVALLTACTGATQQSPGGGTQTAPAVSPVAGSDSLCDAGPARALIGQAASERRVSDAQQRAGAATLRVLQPGQVMTMEYNPRRLTLVVDDQGNIGSLRCG